MDQDLTKVGSTLNEIVDASMEDWSYEQVVSAGEALVETTFTAFWLYGKLVAYSEKTWGKGIIQGLATEWGLSPRSLYDYQKVFTTFGQRMLVRYSQLPYTVFREAARTEAPVEWVQKAETENLSPIKLLKEIKQANVKKYETHEHEWKRWNICSICGLREEV